MVGHTKFAPDCCFGVLKRKFRREKVSCLDDLAAVVEASAVCNTAQLVGREDGTTYVKMYDWTPFLAPHFKRIPGMKQYHHFAISSNMPGVLKLKLFSDSEEIQISILRDDWTPSPDDLPSVIAPPGLSHERQQYLYNSIRPYCTPQTQDVVCPLPDTTHVDNEEHSDEDTASTPSPEPPAKRPRHCSVCGKTGHNARFHKS